MGKPPTWVFCSSTGKKLSNLHLGKNLNRVDPEAVTEEDSDTALYCAWQNDHVATMGVLAEVVDASKEMRKVATFSLDSFFQIQIQDQRDMAHGGEGAGEEVAEGGGGQAEHVGEQTG